MNSNNAFSRLYDIMRYAHGIHQQKLLSMQERCRQAKTVEDLRRLASDIQSFSDELHMHHTLEDRHLFPSIARKIDITHLETHHEQLTKLLKEFENCSIRLKRVANSSEDIKSALTDATAMISKVSKLVIEHETAEEQVIAPENLKKVFTEQEIRQLF